MGEGTPWETGEGGGGGFFLLKKREGRAQRAESPIFAYFWMLPLLRLDSGLLPILLESLRSFATALADKASNSEFLLKSKISIDLKRLPSGFLYRRLQKNTIQAMLLCCSLAGFPHTSARNNFLQNAPRKQGRMTRVSKAHSWKPFV